MVKSSVRPVSIKDVAKQAGVSISTVSNVLNGTKAVSPKLTKRVTEAVKSLGYETNLAGRQLKTGRSQQIAVVVPNITSIFFPNLTKSIHAAAEKEGYTVSIFGSKGDIETEKRIISLLRARGYEGVMLSSCADVDDPKTEEYVEFLHSVNFADNPMHIICLEAAISPKLDAVVVNDAENIMRSTEHLIQKGCKHLAHIAAPNQYLMGKLRQRGFLTAMMLGDLPVDTDLIVEGNYSCQSGYDAMAALWATGKKIDGIVAGNDQMAVGAINFLKEQNVRIPEEIAVVGFGDNTPASLIAPSLTTIHVPKAEMGMWAFDLFRRRVNKDTSARMLIQLEGELVVRNSTDPHVKTSWDMDW